MLPRQLSIKKQVYPLPIFCPDATRGVVRSLDSQDLLASLTNGVIINTWHLHERPGEQNLANLGGVKKLMNFPGLAISDSGGFQIFSLFQKKPGFGKVTDEGLVTYTGPNRQHKVIFTPEDSIRMQFAIGSDIMICLDDYTPLGADEKTAQKSVARTLDWARRCKNEFEQQCKKRGFDEKTRPHLYGVIQGDRQLESRRACAEGLLKIGFDGFGLGGLNGKPDLDTIAFNAKLTPDEYPRYALGFGKPEDIIALYHLGYSIFDCVLPTRDARHGQLYVFKRDFDFEQLKTGNPTDFYQYFHLDKGIYSLDEKPIDEKCACHTCQNFSRAYLHHLFKSGDSAFYRLATIHNLYFYQELMALLRH